MVIDLSNSSRKHIIFTACIFLLLASSIPVIILREVFHKIFLQIYSPQWLLLSSWQGWC